MENKRGPLSAAVEDYIRAIYQLQAAPNAVTTTALAKEMRVSAASATNMIKRLAVMGLVRHSPYRGVTLTRPGEKIALEILRHHRLIELFLNETLGIPWDEVHAEAHKLEHVLSDSLEDHISEFLGDPTEDPHGDPIPTKSGTIAEPAQQPLDNLAPGKRATIRRVSDQNPEHLRYFSRLGLVPNATVDVLKREPFGGPLHIQVESGDQHVLDAALAHEIWVTFPPGASPAIPGRKHRYARNRSGGSR
jgi:DtxR family Mn-dependent transcriptional regulator